VLAKGPRRIQLNILRNLSADQLVDALVEGLGPSARARYHPGVRALFVGPSGTGGPADPAAAAPIVAAPAAEPHGGGAVQSLAGAPDRDAGPTEGGGGAARVAPASRTERAVASTFTGAASRRAQSTKVGQPANEPDRQYAAWWARARGAAGLSAKHRWRWSGPGAR